jgi:hypothetical protein
VLHFTERVVRSENVTSHGSDIKINVLHFLHGIESFIKITAVHCPLQNNTTKVLLLKYVHQSHRINVGGARIGLKGIEADLHVKYLNH